MNKQEQRIRQEAKILGSAFESFEEIDKSQILIPNHERIAIIYRGILRYDLLMPPKGALASEPIFERRRYTLLVAFYTNKEDLLQPHFIDENYSLYRRNEKWSHYYGGGELCFELPLVVTSWWNKQYQEGSLQFLHEFVDSYFYNFEYFCAKGRTYNREYPNHLSYAPGLDLINFVPFSKDKGGECIERLS